jgi:hypothetical protein
MEILRVLVVLLFLCFLPSWAVSTDGMMKTLNQLLLALLGGVDWSIAEVSVSQLYSSTGLPVSALYSGAMAMG